MDCILQGDIEELHQFVAFQTMDHQKLIMNHLFLEFKGQTQRLNSNVSC